MIKLQLPDSTPAIGLVKALLQLGMVIQGHDREGFRVGYLDTRDHPRPTGPTACPTLARLRQSMGETWHRR